METFFTLIIGALFVLIAVTAYRFFTEKQKTNYQATVLVDQIKKVCKFVTVEGDFAEIYHYENVKERYLKLISSRKKALIVINAKAQVGFDLSKIEIETNIKQKKIILTHFPQPEILSIENDINYYDKKEGFFNKFEAQDLTELQKEAKQHIINKVPESNLYNVARKEALDSILLIENVVKTIGWQLDYSKLKLENPEKKTLKA
jgi:predicted SPOUT superfamily RNA methylase MTH1